MSIFVLIYVLVIAYAKGYGKEPQKYDPYYSIVVAIPEVSTYYGLLAGAAFTLPISVVGIFMVLIFILIVLFRELFLTS